MQASVIPLYGLNVAARFFSNIGKIPQSGNVSLALLLKYFNALVEFTVFYLDNYCFFPPLEGSPKHVLARDSVTSNMSYVLTQEPQPWTCDSRPCSGEARPPFPLPLSRDSRPCSGEHRPPPPLPWTRDSRPCSGEDRPPPPLPWTRDSKPCSGEDRPPPPLPWTRDSRPCSGEARPTPPLRKVPSPLHIRADTARAGE